MFPKIIFNKNKVFRSIPGGGLDTGECPPTLLGPPLRVVAPKQVGANKVKGGKGEKKKMREKTQQTTPPSAKKK